VAALKTNSAIVGTVNQHYADYGYYVIPIMQDILAGKPVPAVTHQVLTLLVR
jgi:hypothetical protein